MMIYFSHVSYGAYDVIGLENWNHSLYMSTDVVIHNGGCLVINADIYFSPFCTITVEIGGKLSVNGAILGCTNPGELWGGIVILGNKGLSQNGANQGIVELNNTVIENAICGVLVGRKYLETRNNGVAVTFIDGGGVLTAVNTTFINNIEAVHFNPYVHRNSYNYNEVNNYSSFTNCDFFLDNNARFLPSREAMVYLTGVRGVKFYGCNFHCSNALTNTIGIYANDAGFMLNTTEVYGIFQTPFYTNPCSFSGLKYGIYITCPNSKQITILNTNFLNNYHAIEGNSANNIRIESCNINGSNEGIYNLGLSHTAGYKVENNTFDGGFIGFYLVGKNPNNEYVKYNTFQNIDCQAILIRGYHSVDEPYTQGLKILCNKFDNNNYDIYINNGSSIRKFQGELKGHKAGNHFGPNISAFNIFNHASNPELTYCFDGTVQYESPQVISSNINLHDKAKLCTCIGVGYLGTAYYENPWIVPDKPWINDKFEEVRDQYSILLYEYNQNYASTIIDWDAYMNGNLSYQQQVDDYFELSLLKDTMTLLCQYSIQILLSEDELNKSEFKLWLSRYDAPNMDFLLAECYLDEDSIIEMNNILDTMLVKYSSYSFNEISNYKTCLNYLSVWNFDNNDTVFITNAALDSLNQIASGTEIAALLAKSILARITGDMPISNSNWPCPTQSPENAPLNIKNMVDDNKITISPNPTTDKFNLHANGNNSITRILIYDIYGKRILSKEINANKMHVDVSEYSKGIYFINCIMNDGASVIKKIIKK